MIIEEWKVLGMSCSGCEASVERALEGVHGLRTVRADSASDLVRLDLESVDVDRQVIRQRIEAAGFDVGEHA